MPLPRWQLFWLLPLLLWLAIPAWATIELGRLQQPLPLGQQLTVLQDDSGLLTLADVTAPQHAGRFRPVTQQVANFGYSRSTVWLRIELDNRGPRRDWQLGVHYPQLDYLDFYQLDGQGRLLRHEQAGDQRPFGLRPLPHRQFHFPLLLATGQRSTVYLQVRSAGTLLLPLSLTTPQWQQAADRHEQLLAGFFGGTLLAMLLYNLLLYLSLRERSYLYYVLYIASFGLSQATLYGLGSEYLWPDGHYNNVALPLATGLTALFLGLFSRRFLQLPQQWPAAARVIDGFIAVFAAVAIGAFFLDYGLTIRTAIVSSLIAPVALFVIAIRLWRRGYQPARYFLIAFAALLLGFLANGLTMLNLTPDNPLTGYGMPVGSMLEITLLSFALAHRLKLAQEANQRLQQAHAAELEQRVGERTRELDQALQELTLSNARLRELTLQDALTGLKNRKFFDEQFPLLWRHGHRWRQPLALLMIDIDFFKQVNDRYGHPAGDAALKRVAAVIAGCANRPGDQAIRYGGEEFAVLLPNTGEAGLRHVGECIRSKVAALPFSFAGTDIPLSVSIGAACCIPGGDAEMDALLTRADQLLYRAKQAGRNRCEFTPPAAAAAPNC